MDIDQHPNKVDGDFGYIGEYIDTAFDEEGRVWTSIKKLGVDSILVGHRHSNSASAVYNGIRFQFGQKSSTYERTNFQLPDGTIVEVSNGAPPQDAVPLVGGTVMPLSKEDGSIKDPYIYLCKNP
ncbi:MAG: hypothetical protein IJB47_02975 [Oscillospiraceae bacterium]|nr:hypothetical protein [Oscillospiraceae bacterium]